MNIADNATAPFATATHAGYNAAGLSEAAAEARLARDGPNILPVRRPAPAWRLLAAQMVHFFACLLWVAGVLAIVAGMPQLGVAIFVVVVINGVFAFVQEHRAERAAERLRDLLPRRVVVIRDGHRREIDALRLVRDDLVVVSAGDHISADLAVVECHGLAVDTSTLTGESVPERPDAGGTVLAGTFATEGEALGRVVAAGAGTRLAAIASLSRSGRRPRTPLALELHRVVRAIAAIALSVGSCFFAITVLLGMPPSDGFLFAIGVTVALVPEGLLPTVTLSLARGAQRMAARSALVRRLEAVETLGSTTFICTDKTGTLTRNEMAVVEVWTPSGRATIAAAGYDPAGAIDAAPALRPALERIARSGRICSDGRAVQHEGRWVAHGDPMEAAIDVLARRLGAADDDHRVPIRRFPFDPRRRRMSVIVGTRLYVKGAPDAVLARCDRSGDDAGHALEHLARKGLRVLAVAERNLTGIDLAEVSSPDEVETGLQLLGLIGLEDPPRAEAAASIATCRTAGIRVGMITGDHPATAAAIARETGLLRPGSLVLVGAELPDDDRELGELLDHDGVVVSRVTPEQKLQIARALRARGHVVAMTGDGVNDGPALQEADIGVAMGRSGTDVAREAADVVLLDDNIATIVAAVEGGRATFQNIRRFLTYHLTDNVAQLTPFVVWALTGGWFPLAIGVLQILALDIGTDLLPALALGAEPPQRHILERPPERGHLVTRDLLRRVFAVLGPTEAVVTMVAFVAALAAAGWRPGDAFPGGQGLLAASGAAFTAIVLGQMANAFACRSTTRPVRGMGWRGNPLLLWAVLAELAALAAFLTLPALASLLDHRPPPAWGLAVALLAIPAVLAADTTHKWWRQQRSPLHGPPAGSELEVAATGAASVGSELHRRGDLRPCPTGTRRRDDPVR